MKARKPDDETLNKSLFQVESSKNITAIRGDIRLASADMESSFTGRGFIVRDLLKRCSEPYDVHSLVLRFSILVFDENIERTIQKNKALLIELIHFFWNRIFHEIAGVRKWRIIQKTVNTHVQCNTDSCQHIK